MESGAKVILECLRQEGVEVVFGYPGGAVLPLYDALYDFPLRHVLVRHEQAAAHAADGYARATGKVGVCIATSGPGATNLITGLATAYMDSIPMVAITGQVATNLIGTDAFQEADVKGISTAATKHNYLVKDAAELPRIIQEAFYIARTGRPGPVLIDIPKDITLARENFRWPTGEPRLRGYKLPGKPDPELIEKALQLIATSKRPLMIVGGGAIASGAEQEVRRFAEVTGIPVISTLMGLGVYPGLGVNHLGLIGMHGTFASNRSTVNADLILGLGIRFDDRVTGNVKKFAPKAKIIHIDIDPAEINKLVPSSVGINGDLKQVLQLFLERVTPGDYSEWLTEIEQWKTQQGWDATTPMELGGINGQPLKPQAVIQEVYKITNGDAVVATDVGQHQMWTALLYPFQRPRQFITSGGLGTMGYGLPAAMGAQFANPEEPVWLITGDGSFQMNLQELATIKNYDLPIKIVIINNHCLGMVRQWQELFHQKRYSAIDIPSLPDYEKLAEAYGHKGMRITDRRQLAEGLQMARETDGCVILDIVVEAQENVFPMVPAGAALEDVMLNT